MGLFRNGKTRITTKFQRTDLVICSHSREGKTLFYNEINMVVARYRVFYVVMTEDNDR